MKGGLPEAVARAICQSTEADNFDALGERSIVRAAYVQQALAAIEITERSTETRFWSIVDRYGLSGLPSDMWTALELLVERARKND